MLSVTIKQLCRILNQHFVNTKNMSVFIQKFNPIVGKKEWTIEDDNYDFHQEVARSAYADMLHDVERNQMYFSAIKKAVETVHGRGKIARVLDIGTGTGLLSMMAASCGAEVVTACEAFTPMATCSKEIIKNNGFADVITVIPKRSTELVVGPDCDMETRANILVTEVFDTELIGEGALSTFSHAHQNLLEKSCIVVPSSAVMYAQIVESDTVIRWNQPQHIKFDDCNVITPPSSISGCCGAAAVHDIQLSELSKNEFQIITKPTPVFRFDFSGKEELFFKRHSVTEIVADASGLCQAVFMWWELQMDLDAKTILSCAPVWAHPTPKSLQWRDHWMQAIYYPTRHISVKQNEILNLHAYHDEYSLSFNFESTYNEIKVPPACTCRFHVLNSRTRVGMLNDDSRNENYIKILKKVISKGTNCLCISDGSLLPIMAAKLGAKHVYSLEKDPSFHGISNQFVEENGVQSRVTMVNSLDELNIVNDKIDVIIGEPFFSTSLLPWDNLYFWHSWMAIDRSLLSANVRIRPGKISIYGIGVEFKDLSKIRYPVSKIEGFDVTPFNDLIEKSTVISDSAVEPHPLWEYPCAALTKSFQILSIDMTTEHQGTMHKSGQTELHRSEKCNGVALWADFEFDKDIINTTGPVTKTEIGSKIIWDKYSRQGVYFLKNNPTLQTDPSSKFLNFDVKLLMDEGEIEFVFEIL